jgi:tetratricopeptide (TPR) repeat protein
MKLGAFFSFSLFAFRFCRSTFQLLLAGGLLTFAPVKLSAADPSAADPQPAPGSPGATRAAVMEIFADQDFRKRALENFNIHSDLEPKLPATEKEAFTKIADLAATDVVKAYFELRAKITPDSSAVFDFTLGSIAYQLNRPNEAAKYLESATRKFPTYLRAYKNLGLIQLQQGRTDAAIKTLTRAIELGGGDGNTFGLLGTAYVSKENFVAAEAAFRNALLLQPNTPEWKLGLARCIFRQNKFAEAVSLMNDLIQRQPDKPEFWLLLASAHLGLKEPVAAATCYEMVDRLGKATPDTLMSLADIYLQESNYPLAVETYLRALDLKPDQKIDRPLRAAEVLNGRGAPTEAAILLAKLQAYVGNNIDADKKKKMLKLEAKIASAEGKSKESAEVLEKILAEDPLDGDALLLLGQHYAKSNQPEKAIFLFERAAGMEQFEADAKVRHAQVLVTTGKYDEAVPLLKRAQEIKPRESIARYLEQIERLLKTRAKG